MKKYIEEEISAIDENISISEKFLSEAGKRERVSNLEYAIVETTTKMLKDVRALFQNSKTPTLQVESIYDRLPNLYLQLGAVIAPKSKIKR